MYVVVDLEATCKDKDRSFQMETIEIGAVAFSPQQSSNVLTYQSFIKPVINPELTEFCRNLTSIKQSDVNEADEFFIEMPRFAAWLTFLKETVFRTDDLTFCSWGNYDRRQLARDCALHKVTFPFDRRHINIKENFATFANQGKGCGMPAGAAKYGIPMEGIHHRGIDDAIMITKIFKAMLEKGLQPHINVY